MCSRCRKYIAQCVVYILYIWTYVGSTLMFSGMHLFDFETESTGLSHCPPKKPPFPRACEFYHLDLVILDCGTRYVTAGFSGTQSARLIQHLLRSDRAKLAASVQITIAICIGCVYDAHINTIYRHTCPSCRYIYALGSFAYSGTLV